MGRVVLPTVLFSLFVVVMFGCAGSNDGTDLGLQVTNSKGMKVAAKSVEPGTTVTRAGTPVKLKGRGFKKDSVLPQATLYDGRLAPRVLSGPGKVRIVSIVPSLDTAVCEEQTHILGETDIIAAGVERIVVSRDLPMAQQRFAKSAKLTNLEYLSDYKSGTFGESTGLLMEGSELLARAVLVLDQQGKVAYYQVVPEITALPDMTQAIRVANKLAASTKPE